jgi:hypothetical protein
MYFEIWWYLNDYFYNFPWINHLWRNYSLLLLIYFYFLLYFLIFYSCWFFISKIFKTKKISFWENAKYFSWLYLITPILTFIYPILLGLSDTKISKQFKHIIIWIFFSIWVILYIENFIWIVNSINIIYFFPIITLSLVIWKEKTFIKKIIKYHIIWILIIILLTQPFYKKWFYNKKYPENQKICYSRSVENSHRWPCFKIFKGFKFDEYLRGGNKNISY